MIFENVKKKKKSFDVCICLCSMHAEGSVNQIDEKCVSHDVSYENQASS